MTALFENVRFSYSIEVLIDNSFSASEELCSKWLQAHDFPKKQYSDWNSANKIVFVHLLSTAKPKEPVIDPTRFRT